MMGMGEKTPKYTKDETTEKITRLVALPPHRPRSGSRLFFGVRKHRKQVGEGF